MRIPPSGGRGRGAPPSPRPLATDTSAAGKDSPTRPGEAAPVVLPSAGSGKGPVLSSPLVRLMGNLWNLSSRMGTDEILERLGDIPAEERKEALFLHLLLAKKKINLTKGQWEELWALVKEKPASFADEGGREGFFPRSSGGEPLYVPGDVVYFRLVHDRGEGERSSFPGMKRRG